MLTSMFLPTVGGIENHVHSISVELCALGHDVHVVHTIAANKEFYERERMGGITVHRLHLPSIEIARRTSDSNVGMMMGFVRKARMSLNAGRVIKYIKKLEQNGRFDIIHQHDFSSNWLTTRILSRRYPVILTNHTGEFLYIKRIPGAKFLVPFIMGHYKAIVAPSRELQEFGGKELLRSVYIPNGVDTNLFTESIESGRVLREKLGIPADCVVVLCARRWAPTKGIIYLVDGINNVLESVKKKVVFIFVGNESSDYADYKNEILSRINNPKIVSNIKICGNIPQCEMASWYNMSDLVVLPSLMEATSLSGLEAMACGKPLVATNVGGIPEICRDGVSGVLVKPKSSEEISQVIINLVNDDEARMHMGSNAKSDAINFGWNRIVAQLESIYKDATG